MPLASRIRGFLIAGLLLTLAAALGLRVPFHTFTPDHHPPFTLDFSHAGSAVRVTFLGELSNADLFGARNPLPIRPVGTAGGPEGTPHRLDPDWLHFEYSINGVTRTVLIAKQPVANFVSWDAIARAGAALGDGSAVRLDGREYPQNATITDAQGNTYRVRLPTCGRSTMAPLSDWNLLIGAVHEGDVDFTGERYGWIPNPYSDADLKVGYHGSLNWCQKLWREGGSQRVLRG